MKTLININKSFFNRHLKSLQSFCDSHQALSIRGLLFAVCVFSFAGCSGLKSVSIDNPVVGPPPPRVQNRGDLELDQQNYASLNPLPSQNYVDGQIVPTNSTITQNADNVLPLEDSQIVATVNGTAILASEVLEPFQARLIGFKKQASKEQYQAQRTVLLKQQLPVVVEQQILIEALKGKVKKEQLDAFEEQLDENFVETVQDLLKRTRSENTDELNEKLKAQGTSLATLRKAFGKKQMAMFYLYDEAKTNEVLSRADLVKYYNEHSKEFSNPARAKWREISVSYKKHGSKAQAAQVVKTVIEKLKQGSDFAKVAEEHSDGATAPVGGLWDWTLQESLADENIGSMLFSLPVGQVSEVYLGENAFKIVKVVEREEASMTPLSELQDKIKEKIISDARSKKTVGVIDGLKETFVIRTMFDDEKGNQ